jgi:hypothetical protein
MPRIFQRPQMNADARRANGGSPEGSDVTLPLLYSLAGLYIDIYHLSRRDAASVWLRNRGKRQ